MWEARNTAGRAWRRILPKGRASRTIAFAGASVAAVVLLVGAASLFLDAPVRRTMEREVNRRLTGYSVQIGHLDLQLYRLALDLENVSIRQESNPEPPVVRIPRLHASIQWGALLHARLVADFLFEKPKLYVNLAQVRSEAQSPTRLKDRGWQDAALAIFPLKVNLLRVEDARVTYIDQDQSRPLELSNLNLAAEDIRNVRSEPHAYPSPIRASAVVFGEGRAAIDGHADFLAEPQPGFHVRFALREIPLESLEPVSHHANLSLRGGVLSAQGETEYASDVRRTAISDLQISRLRVDYVQPAEPASGPKKTQSKSFTAARGGEGEGPAGRGAPVPAANRRDAGNRGGVPGKDRLEMRIDRIRIIDSEFGYENRSKNPPYRVYLDQANVEFEGYGRGESREPGIGRLTGRFQGSGPARATLKIEPDQGNGADFDLSVRIEDTDMTRMNRLLDAYGNFDVASGRFSLYSELAVRNGTVRGYVKPLFRDMKVYDPRQDKRKGFLREIYEGLVGVVAKLLENHQRDEVATVVELSGPIGRPNSSTLQVIGGLVQNAFFKAILPGLERDLARITKSTRRS